MSKALNLTVEPEVLAVAAERLARTGRTRVPLVLGEGASLLHETLQAPDLPWLRSFDSPMRAYMPAAAFEASTPEEQDSFMQTIHAQATDNLQYLFDRLPLLTAQGQERVLPSLCYEVIDLFNSDPFIAFAQALTGDDRVAFADGQITRYLPGHFLNRHSDANPASERLYAYVLNLSPRWRVEWGGLLHFLDDEAEVTETFVPSFGTLNVFRVPQMHSVAPVSAFAGGPRYSVTGWWRARPIVL